MRKRGQYIIDVRLKFKKGFQKKFIVSIKEKSGKSWVWLANKIGISDHTLSSDWCNEKITLPKNKAKELFNLGKFGSWDNILKNWIIKELPPKWGQIKSGSIILKPLIKPLNSEKLAEFIGIMIGDGHISKKGIRITGNIFEIKHHEYVCELIKDLFGLDARVFTSRTQRSVCLTNLYSKNLVLFLEDMGLAVGNKINNKTRIPKWIYSNKNFMYGALRGLFDTDGGIYSKQKNYERAFIEFQNSCPTTMNDIIELIKKAEFTPSKSSINVRIQNRDEVKKFFQLVGSANPKNIVRYEEFLKSGIVPKYGEVAKLIPSLDIDLPYKHSSYIGLV